MDFVALCGLCLLCLCVLVLLRQMKSEIAPLAAALCSCLFVPVGLFYLKDYFACFSQLSQQTGFATYTTLLLKAVGIAFLGSTVSGLCRECSQAALGEKLEFCSRCLILALSLPVIRDLLEQATAMI